MILTITVFLCVNHVVSLPTNPFGKKMVGDIAFTDDFPENLPRGSCLIVRLYKHPRTDREKVLSRMIVDNPTSLNKTYELSLDNEEELRMAELAVESVVNVGWCDTKDSKEKRKNDFVSPLRNINLSVLRGKDDAAIIKGPNLSIRPAFAGPSATQNPISTAKPRNIVTVTKPVTLHPNADVEVNQENVRERNRTTPKPPVCPLYCNNQCVDVLCPSSCCVLSGK